MAEAEPYSYDDDLRRYRKLRCQLKKAQLRRDQQTLEPRRYTSRDESFATRLERGVSMRNGDFNEI